MLEKSWEVLVNGTQWENVINLLKGMEKEIKLKSQIRGDQWGIHSNTDIWEFYFILERIRRYWTSLSKKVTDTWLQRLYKIGPSLESLLLKYETISFPLIKLIDWNQRKSSIGLQPFLCNQDSWNLSPGELHGLDDLICSFFLKPLSCHSVTCNV